MTRPLPLRAEQPPDDATVVLRAGVMAAGTILRSAERTFDAITNYRQIRLSTFGRLRNAGFALLATFDHPHFTIVLADLSELTIARLGGCFDDAIPNPATRPPS